MTAEVDLAISGMTCASCVARVEKKLNKLDGVSAVVNLATEKAHVTLDESVAEISDADLVAVVEKAGYEAQVLQRNTITSDGTKITNQSGNAEALNEATTLAKIMRVNDLWRRFTVSLIFTIPIITLSMIQAIQFPGWQWVVGALSLPVAFWGGYPFHRAAFRAGQHGSSTMDTLVSLGVIASMLWSIWALLFGGAGFIGYKISMTGIHGLAYAAHPHIYFESAAMIVSFLLLGRWLEARSRRSAGDALQSLLELGAKRVYLLRRASGESVNAIVSVDELLVGDVFVTKPGEKIATDGVVIEGNSAIDNSLLTGESVPREVKEGDDVTGATMNTFGSLTIRATRVGEETTLQQMGRLLTEAQTGKAKIQKLADQISSVFVPAVLIISLLTFLTRIFILGNPVGMALASAITVLVVACPCALGLATPTALLVGSGAASKRGILIRGAEILESAHAVNTVVLDKTGTLTTGVMTVSDIHSFAEDISPATILAIAQTVETYSEHPLARAITSYSHAGTNLSFDDANVVPRISVQAGTFRAFPGSGVSAEVSINDGSIDVLHTVHAGSLAWLTEQGIDSMAIASQIEESNSQGATSVVIALDKKVLGSIDVRDTLRPEAIETISLLKELNIEPLIVSGDSQLVANEVAKQLGITARGEVRPEGKVNIVHELQAQGKRVAMVGDGVNDAAALAAADLSIALGSGTDVAQAASDITIVNSDIRAIPASIETSKRTLTVIKENLAWAFGYNLVAIPAAIAGIILPGLAAAAMASSSVIVVLNSLRLRSA
ncbi:heavy metal translocating P-type ATPase [Arcanobacterium ihumii]|uniref:heavy metal translocating P-type ATPase n=1 Tax=Arcanobacterium ihumii TaxID=2138162 RepID=UPI000F52BCD0|nr:cation-translocating P-type ATPase [Arcanobacterium ihumii]